MAIRIICIGNRQVAGDDFGPRVHDCLAAQPRPAAIDLVDGGLAGLGLLPHLEGCRHVLFVDAVAGFGASGEIVVLDGAEVAAQSMGGFDHAAGLPYLLRVMPEVLDTAPPAVTLIGYEGVATAHGVHTAAQKVLGLATEKLDHVRRD